MKKVGFGRDNDPSVSGKVLVNLKSEFLRNWELANFLGFRIVSILVSFVFQQAELKRKFISETEQLFKLDDAINRRFGPQPSDNLINNNKNTSLIDISTQQMSNRQWRDDSK